MYSHILQAFDNRHGQLAVADDKYRLSLLRLPHRVHHCQQVRPSSPRPRINNHRPRADPRAVVIDSRARGGRPDLLAVVYAVWKAEQAEAVFVISNRKLTMTVVEGLENMGVHAYGPIWDS